MPSEAISVFDIFKLGVGPSSSHTLGPWRAALDFRSKLGTQASFDRIEVHLYGSLAKTGLGHGTDLAAIWGLQGLDPETCDVGADFGLRLRTDIPLGLRASLNYPRDIRFHRSETLPFHPNGIRFRAVSGEEGVLEETYYSVGGGFIVQEGRPAPASSMVDLPFPIERADDLEGYCQARECGIPTIVRENERVWRSDAQIDESALKIWQAMVDCMYRGCHRDGVLPGELNVVRRAKQIHARLFSETSPDAESWIDRLTELRCGFGDTLRWVGCWALAVNEENAAYGRVVTAPTNGSAGVIPAVLCYAVTARQARRTDVIDFLLTAGEIGSLFKKGSTLSAAMGGCQAEIGVSSAMAAAGLCQVMGGAVAQVLMAAEIAMEHHLGLTCDPVGGLVQVPCIERNAMGAVKAITAANIALDSDPGSAKVSLDQVIRTMWQTALDMNAKYKETSEGGLALQIPVNVPEC